MGVCCKDARIRSATLAVVLLTAWPEALDAGTPRVGFVYTIEWLIADSDVVVRATIGDDPPGDAGHWSTAKAHVAEKLKGEVPDEFDFAVREGSGRFPRSRERRILPLLRGRQVILAFRSAKDHGRPDGLPPGCDLYVPPDTPDWSMIDLDGDPDSFVVTMDLRVLTHPEQILSAACDASGYSRGRPRPRSYVIPGVPPGTGIRPRMGGLTVPGIVLPRDGRLEAVARELTRSADPYCRIEGITILGHFRSAENIEIMRALLVDPAVLGGSHLVREASRNGLSRWGVAVEAIERPKPR